MSIKLVIKSLIFLLLATPVFSQVTMRDTIVSWNHFDYSMNENYGLASFSSSNIVTTQFNGIVLENELVKLCLIPEFGGRIISYVYKPTNKEQLYQNPIGVPYEINNNIFYHDWLMVFGGIFPTFPEPEHGKYWNVPWNYAVKETSSEKTTISMWLKDDRSNPNRPGQYNNGITGITCYFDVSLTANRASFDVDVSLENDNSQSTYEYWTCITFAPGSEIGNTYTPSNSEMIVPIEEYAIAWNLGDWMSSLDETVAGSSEIRKYDKLSHLSNWEDMGIAYAHPSMDADFYGVINHENENGLFRLTNDQSKTPGLKFWTWGDERGLSADPTDFNTSARPYIELWSGTPIQFFWGAEMDANEKLSWTETYFPTVGLENVSFLDKNIAFYTHLDQNNVNISAFNPTEAGLETEVIISDETGYVIQRDLLSIPIDDNSHFSKEVSIQNIESFADYEVVVKLLNGLDELYSVELKSLSDPENPLSASIADEPTISIDHTRAINFSFTQKMKRTLLLYNLNGQLINSKEINSTTATLPYPTKGIFMVLVVSETQSWVKKIQIN
ncbi:DUF5107 domain-containing protein [Ekhidna sp.]|uniref:DUF5107 domain-containing protein n=1 Tax=Ekhidna sp. TaxID=2608089 RepID=UPI0032989375